MLGGDALSVERGDGAQRARTDAISEEERLAGFIWKSEDWHAHVISLQVLTLCLHVEDLNIFYMFMSFC